MVKDKMTDEFGPMMPNLPAELKQRAHYNCTSYWCCINECRNCDEIIRYDFDYDKKTEIMDAKTHEITFDVEKIHIKWNVQTNGQILATGELQDPQNTPEGSKCECFCHIETRRRNMAENNPNVANVLHEDEAKKMI